MTKPWFPQRNRADISIALFKNLFFYADLKFSQTTIENSVSAHPNFPLLSLDDFKFLLSSFGIDSVSYPYDSDFLKNIPSPSLLFIHSQDGDVKAGEFVVFYSLTGDLIEYLNCRKGWVIENIADFMVKSAKVALSLTDAAVTMETGFEEKERAYIDNKLSRPEMKHFKLMERFISPEECNHIINLSAPFFKRSRLMDETNIIDSGRTSSSADLLIYDDPVINKIKNRISETLNVPVTCIEDLQVVRYDVGEEYKIHYDTFSPEIKSGQEAINLSGQRIFTGLLYLNSDFVGGQTYFPNVDLIFSPVPGKLLIFKNIDDLNGTVLPSALHAGLPVTTGIKYAVNIWVRERDLKF